MYSKLTTSGILAALPLLMAAVIAPSPALAGPGLPSATTFPPSGMATVGAVASATLNGSANVSGSGTAWFRWGSTTNYGNVAGSTNLTGSVSVPVSATLASLTPGAAYHCRLTVSNTTGNAAFGVDRPFGAPLVIVNGANPMTNECGTAFTDPGVTVADPWAVLAIAAGSAHSLVLKGDRTVVAWGSNSDGQTNVPPGLSNVTAVAAGQAHNLALKTDGTVVAWGAGATGSGMGDDYGQSRVPADLSNVTALAAGEYHSLALTSSRTIVAWGCGTNNSGMFPSFGQALVPAGLSNVTAIAAGDMHCLALKADGTVTAWGAGTNGSGMWPDYGQALVPAGLSNVTAIAAGGSCSMALKTDGSVIAWGNGMWGQTNLPAGLTNVKAIAVGSMHAMALTASGLVAVWGNNMDGQTNMPSALSNVVAIAAGGEHSLTLNADGTMVGWGANWAGQADATAALRAWSVTPVLTTNTPPGSYALTYTTTNMLGGVATATRTVVVADTLPPVLTLLGANPMTLAVNAPFVDPGATAWDQGAGILTSSIRVTGNVTPNQPGTNSLTYTVSDGYGHTSTAIRTVCVAYLPPTVQTLAASAASAAGANAMATFNGSINPNVLSTTAWIEWGTTTGYGRMTTKTAMGSGSTVAMLSPMLTGLPAGVMLHYRAVASNSVGTAYGSDRTFCTPAIALNGPNVVTNFWGTPYADPGASVVDPSTVIAIASGDSHNVALKGDGTVVAWGSGTNYTFSSPNFGQAIVPSDLSNVVAIAAGGWLTAALKSDGTAIGWGNYAYVPAVTDGIAIACGFAHTLVLEANGSVAAAGNSSSGQTSVPAWLTNATAIGAGQYHSLAVRSDGSVVAWGDNTYGQTNVPATVTNAIAVAGGYYHSLALKRDGTVVGWGGVGVDFGQVTTPSGLTNVIAIAAAGYASMALKGDGTVDTWGSPYGTMPSNLSNATAIAAGYYQTLALKSDGTLAVWGANNYGQLNIPATLFPQCAVSGAVDANTVGTYTLTYSFTNASGAVATATRSVVVTMHPPLAVTLASTSASSIGTNGTATLNGSVDPQGSPTMAWFQWGPTTGYGYSTTATNVGSSLVTGARATITGLQAGVVWHYRAVASNSAAVVFGADRVFAVPLVVLSGPGRITNLVHNTFTDPGATVLSPLSALTVSAGYTHSLALKGDGTVAGWGGANGNDYGQVTPPPGLSDVAGISAGVYHSLAVKNDGTVIGWGFSGNGQTNPPAGLNNAVAVAAGLMHSLALTRDGSVIAWGFNGNNQTNVPPGLNNVIAIAAGDRHSLALKRDGTVVGWGALYYDYRQATTPLDVSNAVAIAAGQYVSLALINDGTVRAWGYQSDNQTLVPFGLSNVTAIAAGQYHCLALKSDGTVVAWGWDSDGQASVPPGLSNVIAIAAGGYHSLALKADGTIVAWGALYDNDGQTTVPVTLMSSLNVTGSVDTNTPGIYILTYSGTDPLGATASATRTVVIVSATPISADGLTFQAGQPRLQFTGTPGNTYAVQASTNLMQWATVTNLVADPGTGLFQYMDTGTYPLRFFRLQEH